VKTGGRLIKHARYYWLLLVESHLTRRAVWRHAAEDCDAAGASRIGGLRSASDFGDEIGRREVSARSIGQTALLWVAWLRDAKPTHPGAAVGTVDQNWAKTLPREAGWSTNGVETGEAKWKFRISSDQKS
jgi:hypothetical protein